MVLVLNALSIPIRFFCFYQYTMSGLCDKRTVKCFWGIYDSPNYPVIISLFFITLIDILSILSSELTYIKVFISSLAFIGTHSPHHLPDIISMFIILYSFCRSVFRKENFNNFRSIMRLLRFLMEPGRVEGTLRVFEWMLMVNNPVNRNNTLTRKAPHTRAITRSGSYSQRRKKAELKIQESSPHRPLLQKTKDSGKIIKPPSKDHYGNKAPFK